MKGGPDVRPPGKSRNLLIAILALALLTTALYAPVRHHDFLSYDDAGYVTGNRIVRQGWSREGVIWAFTTTEQANWHPLTWLSHMTDVELFGLDAGAHHLVNALLHTANAILLLALIFSLTGELWPSAFVAALFAVHPLHVESVAWVSERKDILSSLFALLTALVYVRAARRGSAGRSIATPMFFALALLAKPMPVTLPFLLLLLDWWPLGRWSPHAGAPRPSGRAMFGVLPPARLWIEKAPLLLLSVMSSAVAFRAQSAAGAVQSGTIVSLPVRLANAAISCVAYLAQTFVPRGFSIFYPHTFEMPEPWRWVAAVLLLALLVFLALRRSRRQPSFIVGVLWYLGMLVPVLGLVQVGLASRADRYTYLPLTGIFIALAWAGRDLGRRFPHIHRPLAAVALAGVLGCAAAAAGYLRSWSDDETIFRHALTVTEQNDVALAQLGLAAMNRKDWGAAERELRAALQLAPGVAVVHANLGIVLGATDRPQEAIDELRTAVALKPSDAQSHYNLGKALADSGQLEESTLSYQEALRLNPDSSDAANNIGQNLALQGKIAEARSWFSRAV